MLSDSVHWKQFKVRDYEARQWEKARLRSRFLMLILELIDTDVSMSIEQMPARMGCRRETIWRLLNREPALRRIYNSYRRFALKKCR